MVRDRSLHKKRVICDFAYHGYLTRQTAHVMSAAMAIQNSQVTKSHSTI
jgi:hypothetical protein